MAGCEISNHVHQFQLSQAVINSMNNFQATTPRSNTQQNIYKKFQFSTKSYKSEKNLKCLEMTKQFVVLYREF